MGTSPLTGLLVVASMVVAIFYFFPAWRKRSQGLHDVREVTQQVKQAARAQVAARIQPVREVSAPSREVLAARAVRLAGARRMLSLLAVAALIVGGFTALDFAHFAVVTAVSGVLVAASLVGNRMLARRQFALLQVQSVARQTSRVSYADLYRSNAPERPVASTDDVIETRSWTPRYMPNPIHTGHVGSLDQPVIASVSDLGAVREAAKVAPAASVAPVAAATNTDGSALTGENLDEILRRRRAV